MRATLLGLARAGADGGRPWLATNYWGRVVKAITEYGVEECLAALKRIEPGRFTAPELVSQLEQLLATGAFGADTPQPGGDAGEQIPALWNERPQQPPRPEDGQAQVERLRGTLPGHPNGNSADAPAADRYEQDRSA